MVSGIEFVSGLRPHQVKELTVQNLGVQKQLQVRLYFSIGVCCSGGHVDLGLLSIYCVNQNLRTMHKKEILAAKASVESAQKQVKVRLMVCNIRQSTNGSAHGGFHHVVW